MSSTTSSNSYSVRGKVIAITGGSGGIGLATASLLLSHGAKVSVADISQKNLDEAIAKLENVKSGSGSGGDYTTCVVDVRDTTQVESWIRRTAQKFGKLDGAANLAGVIPKTINVDRVEDLKDEDWKFVIDINLTGVMNSMRAEIREMNKGGSIVNASSVAGLVGFAKNAAYVAAKHGVVGLSRSAAKEVGDRGIRVNCISPGLIDTEMNRESTRIRGFEMDPVWAIKRKGEAEEVAELIAWLLSDGSRFITGSVQVIDGGFIC